MLNTFNHDDAIESMEHDVKLEMANELLGMIDLIETAMQTEKRSANLLVLANNAVTRANQIIGIPGYLSDIEADLAGVSLEGFSADVKNLGRKAYAAMAALVRRFLAFVKRIFNMIMRREEDENKKLEDALVMFWGAIDQSDISIKALGLTPGKKPTVEEQELISAAEYRVVLDSEGNVADRKLIESDMSILIPKVYRSKATIGMIGGKQGIGRLGTRIDNDVKNISRWLGIGANTEFADYGKRLFTISGQDDFNWLKNERIDYCNGFVRKAYEAVSLKPMFRTNFVQTAFSFESDLFHAVLRTEMLGEVKYVTGMLSSKPKAWNSEQFDLPKVKRWPKVPSSEFEVLKEQKSQLETISKDLETMANKQIETLEAIASTNGTAIEDAISGLKKHGDDKNPAVMKSLTKEINGFSKAARSQAQLYMTMHKGVTDYSQILGQYLQSFIVTVTEQAVKDSEK